MGRHLDRFHTIPSVYTAMRFLDITYIVRKINKRCSSHTCKLLIIGGGSGGCTIAAKFSRRLKAKDSVIVIEPSSDHYYQPFFTLVGAGIVQLRDAYKTEAEVMPKNVKWIRDYACDIQPESCCVRTREGHVFHYEYLVVAVGLIMNYSKIPGFWEALEDPNSCVSTIYTQKHCVKTWSDLKKFNGGQAIFTMPQCPIKCPGAPLKIAFLADSYFTKKNIRIKSNITYSTCSNCIFGVKKYCIELDKVAARKNIMVVTHMKLKEILPDRKEAVFHKCGEPEQTCSMKYALLHAVPYQEPPDVVRLNKNLVDSNGFLEVDKYTLQHKKYPNIYGIGDCTNTPNSKTAAAIAKQSYVLEHNLLLTMENKCPHLKYNGYGACPLLTTYNTVVLAEFVYAGEPHETFPWNQAKESVIAYYMKRHLFPFIYWNGMLKGYYHGPEFIRKIINPMGW